MCYLFRYYIRNNLRVQRSSQVAAHISGKLYSPQQKIYGVVQSCLGLWVGKYWFSSWEERLCSVYNLKLSYHFWIADLCGLDDANQKSMSNQNVPFQRYADRNVRFYFHQNCPLIREHFRMNLANRRNYSSGESTIRISAAMFLSIWWRLHKSQGIMVIGVRRTHGILLGYGCLFVSEDHELYLKEYQKHLFNPFWCELCQNHENQRIRLCAFLNGRLQSCIMWKSSADLFHTHAIVDKCDLWVKCGNIWKSTEEISYQVLIELNLSNQTHQIVADVSLVWSSFGNCHHLYHYIFERRNIRLYKPHWVIKFLMALFQED